MPTGVRKARHGAAGEGAEGSLWQRIGAREMGAKGGDGGATDPHRVKAVDGRDRGGRDRRAIW
jgi:hypothetical protein